MSDRIAFCGASGTGKTTLAAVVAEVLGVPRNPVGSRSVAAAMGFASPYDVDRAGRRAEFQRRLLAEKCAWEAAHESFVTDRTPLDNLAYQALHAVESVTADLVEAAVAGLGRYALVVYCQVSAHCQPGDDPARMADPTYHRVYDALLRGLLESHPPGRLLTLALDDREDRERAVFGALLGHAGGDRAWWAFAAQHLARERMPVWSTVHAARQAAHGHGETWDGLEHRAWRMDGLDDTRHDVSAVQALLGEVQALLGDVSLAEVVRRHEGRKEFKLVALHYGTATE